MAKPKILFCTDDCRINTGFARVARAVVRHLIKRDKYELYQHAWFSQKPQHLVPIPIFPTQKSARGFHREDLYGEKSFDEVCMRVQPDLVFGIGNFHMLRSTVDSKLRDTFRLIHYVPVDNFQPGKAWEDVLCKTDELYLYCDWAQKVIESARPNIQVAGIVPHGVDPVLFRPMTKASKKKVKRLLKLPEDSYILGFAGRNLERKRVDQIVMLAGHLRRGTYQVKKSGQCRAMTMDRLGNFVPSPSGGRQAEPRDVRLLLHVPSNDSGGPDLSPAIQHFGMQGFVHCDTSYKVSEGVPDDQLASLYNAMDAFVTFAPGGWELTNLEAMASGLPIIMGDWSAPPDFCRPGALMVDPVGWISDMRAGVLRPIPDLNRAIQHVRYLMDNPREANELGRKSRNAATDLNWGSVCDQWERIIENILNAVQPSPLLEL